MLYFGNPSTPEVAAAMTAGLLGCIVTPRDTNDGRPPPGAAWCADNGCFGKGYPGDEAWLAWLATKAHRADCAFAVAPDVVADAAATLERSAPWLGLVRELGLPVAFVAQDGAETVGVPWDDLDVLFVGGSTAWKLGPHARALVREARRRGKAVHMGRVNSQRRYLYALGIGCDSVDGTYLTFGPDANLPDVLAWQRMATWAPLWEETA